MAEVVDADVEVDTAGFDAGSQTRLRKVLREIGVPTLVANSSRPVRSLGLDVLGDLFEPAGRTPKVRGSLSFGMA